MSETKDWFPGDGGFLNNNNEEYGFSENDDMVIDGKWIQSFFMLHINLNFHMV